MAFWHREVQADWGVAFAKDLHQQAKWRSETAHFCAKEPQLSWSKTRTSSLELLVLLVQAKRT